MLTIEQLNNHVGWNNEKARLVLISSGKRYTKRSHLLSKPGFEDFDGNFVFAQL